jgi:hypothetical protein
MTLREMLNEVLAQSGFLERSVFTSSSDPDDRQMVAIANRVACEIKGFYNWSGLRQSTTIVMTETGGVPDVRYDLPANYCSMVPDSVWETDGSRKVDLPVPENRWFLYKFTSFSDGGTIRARLYGDQIEIHDPEPGESFSFEYIADQVITDSAGQPKTNFTEDTDVWILDDQLFILGVQAHWAQTKLLPQYEQWYANYLAKMNEAIGRDASGQTIGGQTADGDWLSTRSPYYPLYRPT